MFERLGMTISRLLGIVRHGSADREFQQEIDEHLAMLAADFERRGMSPEEARAAARRSFGGVAKVQETQRELRGLPSIETFAADCRYALRSLRQNPGYALAAVLTLALGIGVNTTLFTAYNAMALKPLPVADPARVVRLERWFEPHMEGNIQYAFSYPEFAYVRDHAGTFQSIAACSWPFGTASGEERLTGEMASGNYFAALGVQATLGRTFLPDEDGAPGAHPVVVLSDAYWSRRFQRDRLILGRTLPLNGTEFTIVGVTPEEFPGTGVPPKVPDFWAPTAMQAQLIPGHDWRGDANALAFMVLARMAPGVSLGVAQAQGAVLIRQYAGTHVERFKTAGLTLQHPTYFGNTEDIRFQAFVAAMMLLVGLVWLIACANLANMQLARAAARQREIAVRLALGAHRSRIIRQLLTESTVLSLLGGAAGLLLSKWCARLLWVAVEPILFGPGSVGSIALSLTPDVRVFGYTLLLALATGVAFGLSPALRVSKPDLTSALKQEGATIGARLSRSRMRSLLVAGQVGASMLLLITAGLLSQGLLRSRDVQPGFDAAGVYLISADYATKPQDSAALQQRLVQRLAALPELRSVALGDSPMMGTWTPPILVDGKMDRTLGSYASSSYFATMGIPLRRGRTFSPGEDQRGGAVALVSESTARRFWPNTDALGKWFQLDKQFDGRLTGYEVIGVVADIRYANLSRVDPAHVYLPADTASEWQMLVRPAGDVRSALAAVRRATGSLDPNLLRTLGSRSIEDGPLQLQRTMARTFATFALALALLAVTLSGVGIYGVMSYLVGRRVKEIGVLMALGADNGTVLRAVILQGLRPVMIGSLVGLAGAAALSKVLNSALVFPGSQDLLYGLRWWDPVTFLGITAFLALIASIASAVPARRALSVDPVSALRCE